MATSNIPEGCRVVLLSPLEIHFSQTRIRAEFQDGHTLHETMGEVKAKPLLSPAGTPAAQAEMCSEAPDISICERGPDMLLLRTPFPRIEVTRWRCKLREADGSPKLDPVSGLELYSQEERWFTFDNRRLYCLQRAAALQWPQQARCEVIEIPQILARQRELRKFDTRTFGCSVIVGRRDDPSPETWCWRMAVGLPEEAQPEGGVARQRSMRWRGARRGGPDSGSQSSRRKIHSLGQEDAQRTLVELAQSAMLFFLVYLGLRLIVTLLRQYLPWTSGISSRATG